MWVEKSNKTNSSVNVHGSSILTVKLKKGRFAESYNDFGFVFFLFLLIKSSIVIGYVK